MGTLLSLEEYAKVVNIARARFGAEGEDLVHDLIVELAELRRPPENPAAWILTWLRCRSIDRWRATRLETTSLDGPALPAQLAAPGVDTERIAAGRQLGERLLLAVVPPTRDALQGKRALLSVFLEMIALAAERHPGDLPRSTYFCGNCCTPMASGGAARILRILPSGSRNRKSPCR